MSGGSYEYLFRKEVEDIIRNPEYLEQMAERLAGLGYAEDAARETNLLLIRMRQWRSYFDAVQTELMHIWQAVEWWDSGDWGEEEVKGELEKWRDENARGGER